MVAARAETAYCEAIGRKNRKVRMDLVHFALTCPPEFGFPNQTLCANAPCFIPLASLKPFTETVPVSVSSWIDVTLLIHQLI